MQYSLKTPYNSYIKRINFLFIAIYLLIIFEGVLRKWFFPSFSSVLFFLKDPLVLLIYVYAIKTQTFRKGLIYYMYIFISLFIVIQGLMHSLLRPEGLIIFTYGLRNYLFYIPLVFVAANCLHHSTVIKIGKLTLLLTIPISILVFIQYTSSPTAYINKGLSSHSFVFQIVEGIVRPYGTFTFTMGHVLFVASTFCFLILLYFKQLTFQNMKFQKILLCTIITAIVFMIFTTGSRSIYAYLIITLLSIISVNLLSPIHHVTNKIYKLIFIITLILIMFSFTDTYQLINQRNISAINSEGSPIYRALSTLFQFTTHFDSAPFFGHGVGSGTNAAAIILNGPSEQGMGFLLAEDEWSRIVLELGFILGILYIFFRASIVIWMFSLSIQAYKQNNFFPITLFGFTAPIMLNGVMTMQGTVLSYGTLFSALIIGSSYSTIKRKTESR